MNSGRIVVGTIICIAAAVIGTPIGLAMGGFGLCAASLTAGLVGGSALIGAILAGSVAVAWRKAWWAGSLTFSVSLSFGLVFTTEWQRAICIFLCALATFVTAFVIRYPDPRSLKSGG